MKMSEGVIQYSVASYGYMGGHYKVHFITGTEGHPTLWEATQMRDHGATIVERGRFDDPNLCKDIVIAVEQMNRSGKHYPGKIEKLILDGTIFDGEENEFEKGS
jgi:hypothetical protein